MSFASAVVPPPTPSVPLPGRTHEAAVVRAFVDRLAAGRGHEAPGVLAVHGAPGVGKSRLCAQALADAAAADGQTPVRAVWADFDSLATQPDLPVPAALARLRCALAAAGVATPLFDYAYLCWSEADAAQSPSPCSAWPLDTAQARAGLAAALGPGGDVAAWFARSRAGLLCDGLPQAWSQRERSAQMPRLLACDLLAAIASPTSAPLCLVIDGFERLCFEPRHGAAEQAIATLIATVLGCADPAPPPAAGPLRGRIGFVLISCRPVRWGEQADWLAHLQPLPLGGLSPEALSAWVGAAGLAPAAADAMLASQASSIEASPRRLARVLALAQTAGAVEAHPSPGAGSSASSYAEQALLAAAQGAHALAWEPAWAGLDEAALLQRQVALLPPGRATLACLLAVAPCCDARLFARLHQAGVLPACDEAEFDTVAELPGVVPEPARPGGWRAIAPLRAALGGSPVALALVEPLVALLWQAAGAGTAPRPAFDAAAQAAYADATTLLRTLFAETRIDARLALAWGARLDAGLAADAAPSLRLPLLVWLADLALTLQQAGTADGEAVAALEADGLQCLDALAALCYLRGELAQAKTLQEQVLAGCRAAHGAGAAASLKAMNNLAETLRARGETQAALTLQEQAVLGLRRLHGETHSEVLAATANLALILADLGKQERALALLKWGWETSSAQLGAELPATAQAALRYGEALVRSGDLAALRALFAAQPALASGIDSLDLRHRLGALAFARGDFASARNQQQTTLADCERLLPMGHPLRLRAGNNLAETLRAQGEEAPARALLQQVLATSARYLGARHPDTSLYAWNLGRALRLAADHRGWRALRLQYLDWLRNAPDARLAAEHRQLKGWLAQLDASPQRNAACPCGSGRRYKHCCGRLRGGRGRSAEMASH